MISWSIVGQLSENDKAGEAYIDACYLVSGVGKLWS